MSEAGGRQFKDFAGYLWEAFEMRGREAGVPPGFRRIFFHSLDHPELPPVPGPITTAPLESLSVEQLRGFIKLGHAFPQGGGERAGRGGREGGERRAGIGRDEWESFVSSVRGTQESHPLPVEPGAAATPTFGSEPPAAREPVGPELTESDESLYPAWLVEALGFEAGATGLEGEGLEETAAAAAVGADPTAWIPQAPVHRRHLYRGFESARLIPRRFRARVRVGLHDREFQGEAEGADVPGARVDVAARATLVALQRAEADRVELALQGAKVVRAFDRGVVVVGVYGLRERDVTFLIGASLVRDSIEHAAILATLQATGRWLAWAASQQVDGAGPHEKPDPDRA